MATPKLVSGAQKLLESCGEAKLLQIPGTCAPIPAAAQPTLSPAVASKSNSVCGTPKTIPSVHSHQPSSSTVVPLPQTSSSSSSIMVVAKVATGGVSANGQLQVTKPALSQVASMNQATTPGRTVVITVPRAATPQPVTVAPRLPQSNSSHLPANIQIPAGMMLIRSDSGQLMLVSQQALAQAQQGPRVTSGQAPRIVSHQVSAANGGKANEKVTVIRMAAPPSFLPPPIQKTALVKVVGVASKPAVTQNAVSAQESQPHIQAPVTETRKDPLATFSQETLESVKKCKNFLVTLIKLASSNSKLVNMANNVRGLVRNLLEGKLEAEEFTEQLYQELKSTPQPCLVPFLKKSLPAVRRLTADPQLFIQQASTSAHNSSTPSSSASDTGPNLNNNNNSKQVIPPARRVIMRPAVTSLTLPRTYISNNNNSSSKPIIKQTALQPGKPLTGTFTLKQPLTQDPSRVAFKNSSGSYKEDDDINDVAFMAGVNLREENAKFLTTTVGSVVQSCQDQPFLSSNKVLSRILRTGQPLGVTDVGPEVVALVSHATQECLRGLVEKLTVIAEHRKATLKEDLWYGKVNDVRSQLRFLEEVETLNKKKKDEAEREKLLRLARSRSHPEDPQFQLLKQKAKELQQLEEAQLQQREANMTALAAIGPRRKRPLEQTDSQVSLLPRLDVPRVTRVILRDLLVCMEQDHFLRHSLTLYKAML